MIQDPVKRSRVKSTLLIVILATIPCYLLGMIVLWVSNGVRDRATPTPTVMATEVITEQPTTGKRDAPGTHAPCFRPRPARKHPPSH